MSLKTYTAALSTCPLVGGRRGSKGFRRKKVARRYKRGRNRWIRRGGHPKQFTWELW